MRSSLLEAESLLALYGVINTKKHYTEKYGQVLVQ